VIAIVAFLAFQVIFSIYLHTLEMLLFQK